MEPPPLGLFFLLGWVIVGTLGYLLIEGWSWFDSLYMTSITVFTIGFEEVHPLTAAGRAWTLVVIAIGVMIVAAGASYLRRTSPAVIWGACGGRAP